MNGNKPGIEREGKKDMAHQVESGFAVVQDARDVPWHGLGVQVPNVLTAKEALVTAGLDWAVELHEIKVHVNREELKSPKGKIVRAAEQHVLDVPAQFGVVRDTDNALLGVVGGQYTPVQNAQAFEMFDGIVADGEAKYETAWSLAGGRIVAITAKVPKTMKVGGADPVDLYLVLTTSHDGSRALTAAVTPVRVVCMNTLNASLGRFRTKYTMKHTASVTGKIQEAREALALTFAYADEFQKVADKMIDEAITKADFEKLVEQLYPTKSDDPSDPARQHRMAVIGTLDSSKTIDDSFRYTKWGAFNAVAEYVDWIRPLKTIKGKSVAEARTEATLFGKNIDVKQKALALLNG